MSSELKCPSCQRPLDPASIPPAGAVVCPACRKKADIFLFPAFQMDFAKGQEAEKNVLGEDAVCFYHAEKSASASCSKCGVFLCKLCELDIEGRMLCPKCFEAGKKEAGSFTRQAFLYDECCASMAVFGLVICYFSFILLPAAFIGSIYYWNKVKTPYPRGKWRFVAAMSISLFGVLLYSILLIALFSGLID